jgi:hypothetical protein
MQHQLALKILLEHGLQKVNGMGVEPAVYRLLGYLPSVIGLYPVTMLLKARLVAKQVVDQNHLDKCHWCELGLTLAEASLPRKAFNSFLRKQ